MTQLIIEILYIIWSAKVFILPFTLMTELMEWKPIILLVFAENNAKNRVQNNHSKIETNLKTNNKFN